MHGGIHLSISPLQPEAGDMLVPWSTTNYRLKESGLIRSGGQVGMHSFKTL
jgi:hypothetical protein